MRVVWVSEICAFEVRFVICIIWSRPSPNFVMLNTCVWWARLLNKLSRGWKCEGAKILKKYVKLKKLLMKISWTVIFWLIFSAILLNKNQFPWRLIWFNSWGHLNQLSHVSYRILMHSSSSILWPRTNDGRSTKNVEYPKIRNNNANLPVINL